MEDPQIFVDRMRQKISAVQAEHDVQLNALIEVLTEQRRLRGRVVQLEHTLQTLQEGEEGPE